MIGSIHELASRVRDVFCLRRLEDELAEEIRGHLEMQAAARRAA